MDLISQGTHCFVSNLPHFQSIKTGFRKFSHLHTAKVAFEFENEFFKMYFAKNYTSDKILKFTLKMYFAKNCIFSKILKLLLRSEYVERKELCLVSILENTFFLLNNILL